MIIIYVFIFVILSANFSEKYKNNLGIRIVTNIE